MKPIFYLTRDFAGVTPESLYKGIKSAALEFKQQIFALHGGQFGFDESHIYDLLNPEESLGLITWASPNSKNLPPLYDRYKNLPTVCLSVRLPGMKAILAESHTGMEQTIKHLIQTHNRKKILFIRGPETNDYAQDRYNSYLNTLKSENIQVTDRIISEPGGWDKLRGSETIKNMMDQRNLTPGRDFDAVICVNDKLAMGVISELKRRNIKVPEQISVSGFNHSVEGTCFSPSLTTVSMPFLEQGYSAVKSIMDLSENRGDRSELRLPTNLAVGQSCGCLSRDVVSAWSNNYINMDYLKQGKSVFKKRNEPVLKNNAVEFEINKEITIEKILSKVLPILNTSSIFNKKIEEYCRELCSSLISDSKGDTKAEFIKVLNNFTTYLKEEEYQTEPLHFLLSTIRIYIGSLIEDCNAYVITEDIISQARVFISEVSLKIKESTILDVFNETIKLQDISSKLMTAFSLGEISDIMRTELPSIGINGAYICLYDRPLDKIQTNPGQFHYIFGSFPGTPKKVQISPQTLFPKDFTQENRALNFSVHSLHFKNYRFGHIIFEIENENGLIYTTITKQISSALFSITIKEENEKVQNEIQEILEVVDNKVNIVSENSNTINNGVHEGSTAMEEIASNIKEISRNLQDVTNEIESSVEQINYTNSEVKKLLEESEKIESIVAIISDIAERTKLLSFNASIEAARAGNAGKGFSIVSKEVKNLAYSTISSAESIRTNVDTVQDVTQKTSEAVINLKEKINKIADSSIVIDQAINEQSTATAELSDLFINAAHGTEQITEALNEIKKIMDR